MYIGFIILKQNNTIVKNNLNKLYQSIQYTEKSLQYDEYNCNSLYNQGNILFYL